MLPPILIRPAEPGDAAALTALGRRTFSDAFGADNSPDDLRDFLDGAYRVDIQQRELADDALTYLVAERDGALLAFALLRSGKPCPHVSDPSAIELQRFYLDAGSQGTGLAQRLMASCLSHAAASGAGTLYLGVWEHNARALRFYAAQGFREVGSQVFHVGSDPQQDLVLARSLADAPQPPVGGAATA